MPDVVGCLPMDASLPSSGTEGRDRAVGLAGESRRLWQEGRFDEAVRRLESAAACDPLNPEICLGLGKALATRARYAEAREWMHKACTLAPGSLPVRFQAAVYWHQVGRADEALALLEEALRLDPAHPGALLLTGEIREHRHELEGAEEVLERIRARAPGHPGGAFLEARVRRRRGDLTGAEGHVRVLVADRRLPAELRYRAWVELGQVLDLQGRWDEAMQAFHQGKQLLIPQAGPWWAALQGVQREAERMLAQSETLGVGRWRESLPGLGAEQRLALLCGHPRSGTTLLEQVLESHPGVVSAEETRILHDEAYLPLTWGEDPRLGVAELLDRVDPPALRAARERYVGGMERFLEGPLGGRLLLDKNPAFTILLLPLARIFPEARLLFMIRDPRDVILSCFMQPLPLNPVSSAYLTLDRTVAQYRDAMSFLLALRPRLGNPWRQVHYEEFIRDPGAGAAGILSFLGLPWDPRVLDHTGRARGRWVKSPTYADVTQPIHARAVGRWKRYAGHLEPHLGPIQPLLDHLGYGPDGLA
ncbi:MAG TPA: hypothetical protein DCM86_00285 [Verrucomicrobiales bacterium]|nr:hypothetical protein [Verrucomicrobiales bacterium]